ncbi:30S ribosomal protein S12 methylthiotransferase RimO [Heliophilum fasciatum]|uniref:Ribosomal protein uS12 methylthiotransferase RimO n=1 Tax=Heliophilum fasciatum TaxID=35700 RepID=A0A4R2RLH3_9FIRM|nr:30S ribosomal protein S12 methylthiotransferase RimO [Heliophilum fasciatum]MCW2278514.1 ribosomal protein S12 methylthiotransferase [Heliophilum fasciatum]TCP63469.1 SSU ribosomal protein S12P methylthiotransferase [Heliophilum fasciatum]
MTVSIHLASLGCAKNRVDAEVILGQLQGAGYHIVERPDDATVLIVNTCGFILPAKEESIETILDMARYKQEGCCQLLLVGGCLAQGYVDELAPALPEVDGYFGPDDVGQIVAIVNKALGEKLAVPHLASPQFLYDHTMARVLTTPRHYAYIKVADGCDNHCSYCMIPALRGSFRSRDEASVIAEAKALVEQGVQELLLIAQDTTRYGLDKTGEFRLPALLDALAPAVAPAWIRLMYCHPAHFTPAMIEVMARHGNICRYVDLPLQHVDDQILTAMNRRTTQAKIRQLVADLRAAMPGIALRTSLIVGYPGETDTQFQSMLDFLTEMRFERVGVFTYSQEEATPAGQRDDQIPEAIKQERFDRAMAHQQDISLAIQREQMGKILAVLVDEEVEPGRYRGRSHREAPEVDGYIEFTGQGWQPGQVVPVRITAAHHYDLMGEALHEPGE